MDYPHMFSADKASEPLYLPYLELFSTPLSPKLYGFLFIIFLNFICGFRHCFVLFSKALLKFESVGHWGTKKWHSEK